MTDQEIEEVRNKTDRILDALAMLEKAIAQAAEVVAKGEFAVREIREEQLRSAREEAINRVLPFDSLLR